MLACKHWVLEFAGLQLGILTCMSLMHPWLSQYMQCNDGYMSCPRVPGAQLQSTKSRFRVQSLLLIMGLLFAHIGAFVLMYILLTTQRANVESLNVAGEAAPVDGLDNFQLSQHYTPWLELTLVNHCAWFKDMCWCLRAVLPCHNGCSTGRPNPCHEGPMWWSAAHRPGSTLCQ